MGKTQTVQPNVIGLEIGSACCGINTTTDNPAVINKRLINGIQTSEPNDTTELIPCITLDSFV